MGDVLPGAAHQGGFVPAQQSAQRWVHTHELTQRRDHRHADRSVHHRSAEAFLGLGERLRGVLLRLDVAHGVHTADEVPFIVEQRLTEHTHPAPPAVHGREAVLDPSGQLPGVDELLLRTHDISKVVGVDELRQAMPQQLLRLPPQNPGHRRADPGEQVVGAGLEHHLRGVLREQPEVLARFGDLPGLCRPVGDVAVGETHQLVGPHPAHVEETDNAAGQHDLLLVHGQRLAGQQDVTGPAEHQLRGLARPHTANTAADDLVATLAQEVTGGLVDLDVLEIDHITGLVTHRAEHLQRVEQRLQRAAPAHLRLGHGPVAAVTLCDVPPGHTESITHPVRTDVVEPAVPLGRG